MSGMTLTEFLLERIAEDEAVAQVLLTHGLLVVADDFRISEVGPAVKAHIAPERLLAGCEAKRRIVELGERYDSAAGYGGPQPTDPAADPIFAWTPDVHMLKTLISQTLRTLALPYADHPDYDEAWRP